MRVRGWGLVLAVAVAAGCGSGSKLDGTYITAVTYTLGDSTLETATSPFTFIVLVDDAAGNCPLSSSATLSIDGQDVPFTDCMGSSPPFGGNPHFTLRIVDGGDAAEADVADLAPGAAAMPIPDATIPAGGDFAISIPPELQGRPVADDAQIMNSVDGTVAFASITSDGQSISLQAPAQDGRYLVTVFTGDNSSPTVDGEVTSCTGGARCVATAADLLGPVVLLVGPASAP
ncbi:MAG TPA: hypothetical protein VI456_06730 [Polyangia bacterium]